MDKMTRSTRTGWIFCFTLAMATSRGVWGQGTSSPVHDDLFAGTEKFAKGASDVTEVSMDPDTLGMVGGKDASRAHRMVLNVVRTYEYDKPGMYRIEDVEEFRKRLDSGDWHCSVHTRDLKRGEGTDICSKQRTDGLVEQAIITVEPKELTFIHTIRRGAGGAEVVLPDLGDLDRTLAPELATLSTTMATVKPAVEAQVKIAMAEMQARQAELSSGARNLENLPGSLHLEIADTLNSPERHEQFRELKRRLEQMNRELPRPAAPEIPAPPATPASPVTP